MSARAQARVQTPLAAPQPSRAPVEGPPRPGRPGRATRSRLRLRVRWGFVVAPLIAMGALGIVWVNNATLDLTNRTSQNLKAQQRVQADSARLRMAIARQDTNILDIAARRLQMTQAPSDAITYIRPPAR